jgi:type I restriction enzyme S subunit
MKPWPKQLLADAYWFQEGPGVRTWQFREEGIKLLNVANITKEGVLDLSKTSRHLTEAEVGEKYRHFLLDAGDLVIASSGISFDEDGLLRTRGAFVESRHLPLCLNTSTIRFKPKADVSNLGWLRYWLESLEFRQQITRLVTGSAQQNFGPSHLKTTTISLPPLEQQQRIVDLLGQVEELRKLRVQADYRTAELIPGLFHEMFGDPGRTNLPVKQLAELVLPERPITYGILKPGPDVQDGVPYVRVLDIKKNRLHIHQLLRTSKQIATQYKRSLLLPGDVLVTIRGTVGRTCIVPEELEGANITQDTARLAVIPAVKAIYLVEFMNTPWTQHWMTHRMVGQAVKGLNLGDLRKLPVPVPPLRLQVDFAKRVTEIRELETKQASGRRRLEDLFRSLLHRAFRGELDLSLIPEVI